jgi:hypothetical protein
MNNCFQPLPLEFNHAEELTGSGWRASLLKDDGGRKQIFGSTLKIYSLRKIYFSP